MTRHTASLPPGYFDERYAADPDPWNFAESSYERDKYAATLAALPRPRYAAALEIGCSIGVLTAALAPRCDTLVALDVAEAALDQARARCRDLPGVRLLKAQVPGDWPEGRFDLILLSEVVYYLDAGDVARLAGRVRRTQPTCGGVVQVHLNREAHFPLTGDEAADLFIRETRDRLAVDRQVRTEAYRLDVLRDNGA